MTTIEQLLNVVLFKKLLICLQNCHFVIFKLKFDPRRKLTFFPGFKSDGDWCEDQADYSDRTLRKTHDATLSFLLASFPSSLESRWIEILWKLFTLITAFILLLTLIQLNFEEYLQENAP